MHHLTLEGFIRSTADVRTEFYEQLKRRQLAASRIVRSQSMARTPSAEPHGQWTMSKSIGANGLKIIICAVYSKLQYV